MMAKVVFGMAMSLDGFIQDRDGSVGRLYPDLAGLRETEMLQNEMRMTGAVVMGRHTYDMAQGDYTGYEFQAPIFVITHNPPEQVAKGENENLKFHFVDSMESAIKQAMAAAGDRFVTVVGGANLAQQMLKAGLIDELQIGIVPVLFGDGLRLFDHLGAEPIELEQTQVFEAPGATYLYYRVVQ
jgi:dihydrofolate reductase